MLPADKVRPELLSRGLVFVSRYFLYLCSRMLAVKAIITRGARYKESGAVQIFAEFEGMDKRLSMKKFRRRVSRKRQR